MKTPKIDFLAPELDAFVARWVGGSLSDAELSEWRRVLTNEAGFRENFCDWIRSLREPGWIREASSVTRRKP